MRAAPLGVLAVAVLAPAGVLAQTADFACPSTPLSMEFSGGSKISLTGQADGACTGTASYYFDRTGQTLQLWVIGPTVSWTSQTQPAYVRYARETKAKLWPLQVGKTFTGRYDGPGTGGFSSTWDFKYSVDAYEKVVTPAGTFDAFKVTRQQVSIDNRYRDTQVNWYAPALMANVKYEFSSPTTHISRTEHAVKISR